MEISLNPLPRSSKVLLKTAFLIVTHFRFSGHGRVQLDSVLYFPNTSGSDHFMMYDDSKRLSTNHHHSFAVTITTQVRLSIVVAWTDPPGSVGSSLPLVNNLDLKVRAPNGVEYYGNDQVL